MTIGQKLIKVASKAQEMLAEDEFSREKIVAACNAAAAKGFMSCQIRPSVNVDVSITQHMKQLKLELEKEWLALAWIPHAMPGDIPYKVLEIRWEPKSR